MVAELAWLGQRQNNITDITEAVRGVCADTRTSVICVDEIHNLNTDSGHPGRQARRAAERLPQRVLCLCALESGPGGDGCPVLAQAGGEAAQFADGAGLGQGGPGREVAAVPGVFLVRWFVRPSAVGRLQVSEEPGRPWRAESADKITGYGCGSTKPPLPKALATRSAMHHRLATPAPC